jgi:phosphatidylserine decarboxylase
MAGAEGLRVLVPSALVGLAVGLYMLYFFRDPARFSPPDPSLIVSGADGRIANIVDLSPDQFAKMAPFCGLKEGDLGRLGEGSVTRISIFLSLFDVHVNRAPIAGESEFLGYFPGKHIFTFKEKSSECNQHNSIRISNADTVCLVNQIVGPVARRVVYWPDPNRKVPLEKGHPIGMMKFGSRLDMYFPAADVDVGVKVGDRVAAGVSVVARLKKKDDK